MSDREKSAAFIAARQAEIRAKLAKFQKTGGPDAPKSSQSPPQNQQTASPSSSRLGNNNSPQQLRSSLGRSGSHSGGGGGAPELDLIQRKIAEARARLAGNSMVMPRATAKGIYVPDAKGRVGTPQVALDDTGSIDLQAMLSTIPKREVSTAKANQRLSQVKKEAKAKVDKPSGGAGAAARPNKAKNPYLETPVEEEEVVSVPSKRKARPLKFIQPGKYIQKANQERQQAQLEKLKQEIAQNVRKAGMEVEMDISDKALKKEPGPPAEWWDAPFLPNKAYTDLDQAPVKPEELDQLVTLYIHHPIPIKPPNELNSAPVARSLMLTKKERKKLRRQRRHEAQKEKQDKIRLGLLPPDPPKVKISNLMQVLGQEAIQDPTKIEQKVRKEMEQRQRQHELTNEQRKLSPEERRAKVVNKLAEDKKQSNEVAVFKVKNCAHPKHRYKIEKNAQQYQLSGMVIIHPKCHLVIVEGGPKSIKAYKKLMLRRIDWNDMPPPKNVNAASNMMDIDRFGPDGEENKCYLVWEGQVKSKAFRRFTWRTFESEKMAREELSKWHVEHYWDAAVMAKNDDLAARQPEL